MEHLVWIPLAVGLLLMVGLAWSLGRINREMAEEDPADTWRPLMACAWDEGYARGVQDEAGDMERADNPYRDRV